ncbi:MAG: mechanosensitive ion channel [Lachnospiraceae bacterium]|nr:mechanosensitive ion channel [Lachnospiraceae bacterium]
MLTEQVNISALQSYLNELPSKLLQFGGKVVVAFLVLVIGMKVIGVIRKIIRKSLEKGKADVGVIQFLDSMIKVLLYIVLFLLIAGNFGLEATSVLAVLGSAGVAIGLALQGSLSNFAGGVLILVLKPFRVGDYIIEDTKQNEGTVTEIQLFYTKLRTGDDRVVILPNGTLANTSLVNVTETNKRRLDITVGISYESNIAQAKQIIMQLLEQDEAVLQTEDKCVYVSELGDSAVMIGVRCWFRNDTFWEGKWRLLEAIKEEFDKANIVIPYPQMNVYLSKELSK